MDRRAWQATVHGILQARILEWVAISFSRGSSQPRNRTQVSCIVGRFFTNWAKREASLTWYSAPNLGCVYFLCDFKVSLIYLNHYICYIIIYCFIICIYPQTNDFDLTGVRWVEHGGLPSMGLHRVRHDCSDLAAGGFQIRKGVCQGCILSLCLFNLYAECIMRNTGLDEA